jgi:hypothetical protein
MVKICDKFLFFKTFDQVPEKSFLFQISHENLCAIICSLSLLGQYLFSHELRYTLDGWRHIFFFVTLLQFYAFATKKFCLLKFSYVINCVSFYLSSICMLYRFYSYFTYNGYYVREEELYMWSIGCLIQLLFTYSNYCYIKKSQNAVAEPVERTVTINMTENQNEILNINQI